MTTTDTAWMRQAACAARPELPWTTDTTDLTPAQVEAMRAVCDDCPALGDCVATVDALDITGGWWAGTDRDPYAAPIPAPEWVSAAGVVWDPVQAPAGCARLTEQAAFDFTTLGTHGTAA